MHTTTVRTSEAASYYSTALRLAERSVAVEPADTRHVVTITTAQADGTYPGTVTGFPLRPLTVGERHDAYLGFDGSPLQVLTVSARRVWRCYEVPAGRVVTALEYR